MNKRRYSVKNRPKTKGRLQNFTFRKDLREFLKEESKRQHRDMTAVLEGCLEQLRGMDPTDRDKAMNEAFKTK